MFDYVFYHNKCDDGIMSAWHIAKNLKPKFILGRHHTDKLNVSKMGDLSKISIGFIDTVPLADDILLLKDFKFVTIFDHHKSNAETIDYFRAELDETKCEIIFDITRSACHITEDYFNKCSEDHENDRFWISNMIGQRDIGNFDFPYCREITSTIWRRNTKSKILKGLFKCQAIDLSNESYDEYLRDGQIFTQIQECEIKIDASRSFNTIFKVNDLRYNVWLCFSKRNQSELGNYLTKVPLNDNELGQTTKDSLINKNIKMPDFVCIASLVKNKETNLFNWEIALRSKDEATDVNEIAKLFYSGGHHNAAKINCLFENFYNIFELLNNTKPEIFNLKQISDREISLKISNKKLLEESRKSELTYLSWTNHICKDKNNKRNTRIAETYDENVLYDLLNIKTKGDYTLPHAIIFNFDFANKQFNLTKISSKNKDSILDLKKIKSKVDYNEFVALYLS